MAYRLLKLSDVDSIDEEQMDFSVHTTNSLVF
jgi:hypothetical protein